MAKTELNILDLLSEPSLNSTVGSDNSLSTVSGFISTGSIKSDIFLGGGLPVGRCIQIFGRNGSGKSALSFHAMTDTQNKGGLVIVFATETSFDAVKAEKIGVSLDEVILLHPETLELCFNFVYFASKTLRVTDALYDDKSKIIPRETYTNKFIELTNKLAKLQEKELPDLNKIYAVNNEIIRLKQEIIIYDFRVRLLVNPDLPITIIYDSLNQSPIQTLINAANGGERFAGGMSERARVIGDCMKLVTIPVAKSKICFIIINHVMSVIGAERGQPEVSSAGGNQLAHSFSLNIYMDWVSRDAEGQVTKFKVEKNKLERPYVRWRVFQYFYTGFNQFSDIYDCMNEFGLLTSGRGWEGDVKESDHIYWKKGFDNFTNYMNEHPEYFNITLDKITKLLKEKIKCTTWIYETDVE